MSTKFVSPEVHVGDVVLWFPQADNRNSVGRPAMVTEVGSGGSVNLFLPHRYLKPIKGARHVDDPFHATKRQATLTNGGWEHSPTTKRLFNLISRLEGQLNGVAATPPLPAAAAPPPAERAATPPSPAPTPTPAPQASPVGGPVWAEATNEAPVVEDEYENMSLPDLRATATKLSIPHTAASNRANLRALIREHLSSKVEAAA